MVAVVKARGRLVAAFDQMVDGTCYSSVLENFGLLFFSVREVSLFFVGEVDLGIFRFRSGRCMFRNGGVVMRVSLVVD